jgi:hypothetical protein
MVVPLISHSEIALQQSLVVGAGALAALIDLRSSTRTPEYIMYGSLYTVKDRTRAAINGPPVDGVYSKSYSMYPRRTHDQEVNECDEVD